MVGYLWRKVNNWPEVEWSVAFLFRLLHSNSKFSLLLWQLWSKFLFIEAGLLCEISTFISLELWYLITWVERVIIMAHCLFAGNPLCQAVMVVLIVKHNTHYSNENDIFSSTHWGQVTHLCVGDLTIIGSDNGFSPVHWQAIIWTNVEILLI